MSELALLTTWISALTIIYVLLLFITRFMCKNVLNYFAVIVDILGEESSLSRKIQQGYGPFVSQARSNISTHLPFAFCVAAINIGAAMYAYNMGVIPEFLKWACALGSATAAVAYRNLTKVQSEVSAAQKIVSEKFENEMTK